ncbi:response regulator [bacterium]|nr:response regulator [bacterium]
MSLLFSTLEAAAAWVVFDTCFKKAHSGILVWFMPGASKIFLLDDDLAWRAMLSRWITDWGFEVLVSSSFEEWASIISIERPDLVIVDPSSFENDILQSVLESAATTETPVIVISDSSMAERALELGAADFLLKPCHPSMIRSRLRAQLKLLEARSIMARVNEDLETKVGERTDELERLNRLFVQFVPHKIQERIRSTLKIEPGIYHDARVTILFLDVRGFTTIAERVGPEKSVQLLGELFQRFVPMISRHHGYIDNFGGDSFMAVFEGADSARNAAEAAMGIQRLVFFLMDSKTQSEIEKIRVGIGINTGQVVYAAIGSDERMASTVIGDQVNLSARMEKLTKAFQCQILISSSTYSELPEKVRQRGCRIVDNLRVRGRSEPVEVYELFSGDPDWILEKKREVLEVYQSAIGAYADRRFDEALLLFRECLKIYPQDAVSLEYVRRCRYFLKARPEEGFFRRGTTEGDNFIDPTVRRRFTRYAVNSKMEFEFYHNDPIRADTRFRVRGCLLDLSTEGMMIQSDHLPRVGSIFSLRASFQGTPLETELGMSTREFICQVRWVIEGSGRIGLSFVQLSQMEEEALSGALEKAQADGRLAVAY